MRCANGASRRTRCTSLTDANPGTGKTTIDGIFARFLRSEGFNVVGVAPTARAAAEMRAAGIDGARTIHSEVLRIEQWRGEHFYLADTVIMADEYSMLDTRDFAALSGQAARDGAWGMVSGDDHQLANVDAGGFGWPLGDACSRSKLDEIIRQRDPAARRAHLAEGRVWKYLEWAQPAGRIVVGDDAER